jgi:hypothetical protein
MAALLAVLVAYAMLGPMKLKPRDFVFAANAFMMRAWVAYAAWRRQLTGTDCAFSESMLVTLSSLQMVRRASASVKLR